MNMYFEKTYLVILYAVYIFCDSTTNDGVSSPMDDLMAMVMQMNTTLHKQHRRLVGRMIKLDNKFEEFQTLISSLASDVENNRLRMSPLYNKMENLEEKLDQLISSVRTCQDGNGSDSLQRYVTGTKVGDFPAEINTSKPKYRSCSSHMDREYVIMFPKAFWEPKLPQILISSVEDTTVTLESEHPGVNRTINITSDRGSIVNLPKSIFQHGSSIEKKGILVSSTHDIAVSGFPISSMDRNDKGDIYSAIPVRNLGKSYLYIGYDHSVMSIVALHDNTHVNISIDGWNSPIPLSGTRVRNERYQTGDVIPVTLQRLSTFQIFGDSYLLNIRVNSDKIIGVISGSTVDGFDGKYNSLFSYIPPIPTFGTKFIVPPNPFTKHSDLYIYSRMRLQNEYEFYGRTYFTSGSVQGNRRQQRLKARVPYLVTTSVPSSVAQMTYIWTSWVFPSQTLIPSLSQFSNFYKFMTPTTAGFRQYAAIIIQEKHAKGLRFDGVAIQDWDPDIHVLPDERVNYNVIMLKMGSGQHEVFHVDADVTFGVIIQGMSPTLNYGFPAGLRLSNVCD